MIDNKFISTLPDDTYDALLVIIGKFSEFNESVYDDQLKKNNEYYDEYIQYFGLLHAYCESNHLDYDFPSMSGLINIDIQYIEKFFNELKRTIHQQKADLQVKNSKLQFTELLKGPFVYEFSDSDINRVQILINELRDLISENQSFDENHKFRLLKRLEKLQSEIHKAVSDLDRFWGLIGDAGVALGKFGSNAKPLVDRIKELTTITWRTQAKAENLPPDTPFPQIDDKNES